MNDIFRPKLLDSFRDYNRQKFTADVMAGIIVGIVALPLAIAFAIASGVGPEKGLLTAIIAGFAISALGGSRVQIGGPTGAFIVIVYGIVVEFGVQGLIISTFIAGLMLIAMGIARLGSLIKYIPYSLIIGFTSGIAVIIFSSQIKDLLGLEMGDVPADFTEKWKAYFKSAQAVSWPAMLISVLTIGIVILTPRFSKKIPGSLIAILLATLAVQIFKIPVETIGDRFGVISAAIPAPELPGVSFETIRRLFAPAFTIAMLGAIESLLSAVVADGMIGGNHRSNTELIGQGIANVGSSLFGGIPATGAIARTATNVKNGGRTPVAGIVHAVVLALILIFLGKWASLIPLAALAGILVVIAYNMSEWRNFKSILWGPKGDVAVMLVTFFLTVFIDLTVAIEIGMILAVFTFMRKMIKTSDVRVLEKELDENEEGYDLQEDKHVLPRGVKVFEVQGPLFFGNSFRFKNALKYLGRSQVLIIRMRHVPVIDATGIKALEEVLNYAKRRRTHILLSGVAAQVEEELRKSGLWERIGEENILGNFDDTLQSAHEILELGQA